MKKNYLLILGLGLATFSFGQKKITASERFGNLGKSAVDIKTVKPGVISMDKAGGDVIYSQTFNGSVGDFTTTGADAAVWQFDTNGPSGQYSAASEIITSTTVSNGFMIFDCDLSNPGAGAANRVGQLVSPIIDLTGQSSVNIKFEHTYRTCCSSAWKPFVEVSTDGFATFEQFDVTVGTTGVNDIAPTTIKNLNISGWLATATNLDKFQFRFNFDGEAGNTSHYFWQIDDVAIIESFDYDIEFVESIWGSAGVWDIQSCFLIPTSQIAPIEFTGVGFNNGKIVQNEVAFEVKTTDGAFLGLSDPDTLVVGVLDTMDLTTSFTPLAGTQTHELSFKMTSPFKDATPDNNLAPLTELITLNKYHYGVDNNFADGSVSNAGLAFEVGNVFQIFKDETLYAANIRLSTLANAGSEIFVKLYDMDQNGTDLASVMLYNAETLPYVIKPTDLGNWITIAFTQPIALTAGNSYGLLVGSYGDGGSTDDLRVATAGKSRVLNSLFLDIDDNNTWYYTTGTPMVRMNFNPAISTPTITANASTTICEGESVTLISSASTGNVWSNGLTTRTIVVDAAGDYSVTANGLTSDVTKVIVNQRPAAPTITSSNPLLCIGGTLTLTSSTADSYDWSTGETGKTITVDKTGTYGLRIHDGVCNSNVVNMTVTSPKVPTISFGSPTAFCDGGSVTLTSSSATGNVWSNAETTQSVLITTGETVSLIVDELGCATSSEDTITTVVTTTPSLGLGANTEPTTCGLADGTIELTGTDSGDLAWTGPVSGTSAGVTLPQTLTGLSAGTYIVTLDNLAGCTYTSSFTISDPLAPTAPVASVAGGGSTVLCSGTTMMLVSSVDTDIEWSTGETNDTIVVSTAGTYSLKAGVLAGCISSSNALMITSATSPNVKAGADVAVCMGESVTLKGAGASTYTWDNGVTNAVAFTPADTTKYVVTGTSFNGCSATDTVLVTVNPLPVVTAGTDVAGCLGADVTLTANGAGTVASGAVYVWSNGTTAKAITVKPSADKDYIVVGTDKNGCSGTDTVRVTVNPLPVINFTPIPLQACIYRDSLYELVATPAGGTFSGSGVSGSNFNPTGVTTESSVTISYAVTDNGCTATASQIIFVSNCLGIDEEEQAALNVYPNPTAGSFTVAADRLKDYDVIELHDQLGRVVGTWNIDQTSMDVKVNNLAAGNYLVVVKGQKANLVHRLVVMN